MGNGENAAPRVAALIRKLKSHPGMTILTVLATVIGLIKGIPPAWGAISEWCGVPYCLTYGDVYYYATGKFSYIGNERWIENGAAVFSFKESKRSRDWILLLNDTDRVKRPVGDQTMIVRLPVCGGTAQWAHQNPGGWVDLYEVWR